MVNRDVVFAKINSIQRCLQRIKKVTELDPDSLKDLEEFYTTITLHYRLSD